MLTTIPAEVFDHILSYLALPDLISLRRTSSAAEKSSRPTFASVAFSQPKVNFSPKNLRRLNQLASHETFRRAVRGLLIGFWSLDPVPADYWSRVGRSLCLDPESEPVRQFVGVVARFPNCAGVTLWDEIGPLHAPELSTKVISPGDAAELALLAFASPGAPPMRFFRSRVNRWHRVRAGAISSATAQKIRRVWAAHLEELVVDYNWADHEYLGLLIGLLSPAPKLKTLRLMWPNRGEGRYCRRLALTGYVNDLVQLAPPLHVLMLGQMKLSGKDLVRLLSAVEDTLADLDLYEVRLDPGSWTEVLEHLRAKPFPRLRRISMYQCQGGANADTTAFCPLWKDEPLQASCGGVFEFAADRAALYRNLHVTGVIFESRARPPCAKAALGAILARSYTVDFEVPRDDGFGFSRQKRVPGIRELPRLGTITARMSEKYTRWTGLPVLKFEQEEEETKAPVAPEVEFPVDLFDDPLMDSW